MSRRDHFRNWDGPSYVEGKHVACTSCEGSGVGEYMEHANGDESFCAPCDHCDGTGCEPWRPAGSRDTRSPRWDSLTNLKAWRDRLHSDLRNPALQDFQRASTRRAYDRAVRRIIGRPSLTELSVAESFARAVVPTLAEMYAIGDRRAA